MHRIECQRAEIFLESLPEASVDLIVTDPPYCRSKGEAWDRQWRSDEHFLEWLAGLCRQWRRVLKPSGSIYVFASTRETAEGPTMAARVEAVVAVEFRVLSSIVWCKPDPASGVNPGAGCGGKAKKETLRSWWPLQERAIFGESRAAESIRGDAFEPLRAYLDGERARAGVTSVQVQAALGNQMAGHYFGRSQWELPSRANYDKLRALFARVGPLGAPFLERPYDWLRVELARMSAAYKAARRPFAVSPAVPYGDVWAYPTVDSYKGKHPCEKPAAMALDIVRASSRPGDTVLDTFAGSGAFLAAAAALGRVAWGCDFDKRWALVSEGRVRRSAISGRLEPTYVGRRPPPDRPPPPRAPAPAGQLVLF